MCDNDEQREYICTGALSYATCVIYEGNIPDFSRYYQMCNVTVQEVIEELYDLSNNGVYLAGEGLTLVDRTFNVTFGNTEGTVMEGSWRPKVSDIEDFPDEVNIYAGQGIIVEQEGKNYTISKTTEEIGKLDSISINQTPIQNINRNANIPFATRGNHGVIKVGQGLDISLDGTLSTNFSAYTAGSGLTLVDQQFSLPVTIVGSGGFVKSVVQNPNGLTVTLGDQPSNNTITRLGANGLNYTSGDINLIAGDNINLTKVGNGITVSLDNTGAGFLPIATLSVLNDPSNMTGMLQRSSVLNQWLNSKGFLTTLPIATANSLGGIRVGSGLTIDSNGVLNANGGTGPQYTAGNGITIAGGVITNSLPNASHTGDVSGSSSLTINQGVVDNSKLSEMPPLTVKVNTENSDANPTDAALSEIKTELKLNRVINIGIPTTTYNVSLDRYLENVFFIQNTDGGVITNFVVPDGEYEGQKVTIHTSVRGDSNVTITGSLLIYDGDTSEQIGVPHNFSSKYGRTMYWDAESGRWILPLGSFI